MPRILILRNLGTTREFLGRGQTQVGPCRLSSEDLAAIRQPFGQQHAVQRRVAVRLHRLRKFGVGIGYRS